jgi:hypothetical protein
METVMETDHQVAPSAIEENLNFFSIPAQDVGVLERKWVTIRPINSVSDTSPIEFNVDGNMATYLDLKNSTVCVKFKVVKADGSDIGESEQVAPINLFSATMWKQVDVQLGYENLRGVNIYYPYKAMFDVLLDTTEGYKKSQLAAQLFRKDNSGSMDADNNTETNDGFNWRNDKVVGSKPVEMEGNLFLDICQQERLILNGVQLNIKMWPSRNPFKFMSSTEKADYKVKILEAYMKVCLITVNPAIMVAQREVIQMAPAVYPLKRSEIRVYSMSATEMNLNVENLFNGDVPHFLCVGLVSTDAFNGSYNKNPFNFANFNLSSIGFYVDGHSAPVETPFRPDFSNDIFTQPFLALSGNKKGNGKFNNGIYWEDFGEGYAIYIFEVRSEKELKRKALTRLTLDFKEPLKESVTVVTYARFPDLLEIDSTGKVTQS